MTSSRRTCVSCAFRLFCGDFIVTSLVCVCVRVSSSSACERVHAVGGFLSSSGSGGV